jgi:excisionase family DNA binding protein
MRLMARKIWDRILSLTEAAERTGLSESWMRRLLMAGRLEGKKIGKTWLVLAEDVDALAAGQRKPGRPPGHK